MPRSHVPSYKLLLRSNTRRRKHLRLGSWQVRKQPKASLVPNTSPARPWRLPWSGIGITDRGFLSSANGSIHSVGILPDIIIQSQLFKKYTSCCLTSPRR